MPKRINYYLLLVLLGLIAATQLPVLLCAVFGVRHPPELADPDLSPFGVHKFLRQVVNLRHLAVAVGSGVLLLCIAAACAARKFLVACETAVEEARYVEIDEPEARISTAAMAKLASSVGKAAAAKAGHADRPMTGAKADVVQLSAMVGHLAHKAQHDSLTGLPNRSLALDRMKQMLARAERQQHSFAVLFLDLNGFKCLNDTYGHEFGDKVLRKTAERLSRSVRSLDTVARLGGDEFLVIMDQMDACSAMETARVLTNIVRQPVVGIQGPVSVGMSTGVAIYPQHGTAVRDLIGAADAAMYSSKQHAGEPVLADAVPVACAASPQRQFEITTTSTSRLLQTWEGTMRGLRALNALLLGGANKQ